MSKKIFVYGTLRKGQKFNGMISKGKFLGTATLDIPYKLWDFGVYPGALKDKEIHQVFGEVYEVSDTTFNLIAMLENYPTLFGREKVSTPYGEAYIYHYKYVGDSERIGRLVEGGDWVAFRTQKEKRLANRTERNTDHRTEETTSKDNQGVSMRGVFSV